MQVLLVEDDDLLGDSLHKGLAQFGHEIVWVKDCRAAVDAVKDKPFDGVIINLNLPQDTGLTLLTALRMDRKLKTPIIILAGPHGLQACVRGLDAGADDYLIKPFDLETLCARIDALQTSAQLTQSTQGARFSQFVPPQALSQIRTHGNLELDLDAYSVTKAGKQVALSKSEFLLLAKLLENRGRILTRDQLLHSLYGWDDETNSNTLEVHISNIRKKLGSEIIKTKRGVGYLVEKNDQQK